jgi:hypothetical protein
LRPSTAAVSQKHPFACLLLSLYRSWRSVVFLSLPRQSTYFTILRSVRYLRGP